MHGRSTLESIAFKSTAQRHRASSYDPTGGNTDSWKLPEGQEVTLLDVAGPGAIKHIWFTIWGGQKREFRNIILRIYWDHAPTPAVASPIGDFFGIGLNLSRNFASIPIARSPQGGGSMNCFWTMPFKTHAKVTLTNETGVAAGVYFYIDYELHPKWNEDALYFHAKYRQEYTKGVPVTENLNGTTLDRAIQGGGTNLDGKDNYLFIETQGKGQFVGIVYSVVNLTPIKHKWPGEGDDFFFIDGEPKPRLLGTGTEDFFCCAWCPHQVYDSPYFGIVFDGGRKFTAVSYYRFFLEDPIYFEKSLIGSIEHGHANRRSDYFSTVAFWYLDSPTNNFGDLVTATARMPPPFKPAATSWK
jgi:hypothetical protein